MDPNFPQYQSQQQLDPNLPPAMQQTLSNLNNSYDRIMHEITRNEANRMYYEQANQRMQDPNYAYYSHQSIQMLGHIF